MKSTLLAGSAIASFASALLVQPAWGQASPAQVSPAQASSAQATPVPSAQPGDSAAAAQTSADGGEVVVTGSRIVRDGYTAPTPVTVATTEDLQKSTPTNIPDGLNKLPQFTNSQSPSRSALNFGSSPTHGNVLNLRGVGPTRTLILFDGIRVPPTTYLGTVDTNVIPEMLIQRVEVVTGGASAAYGSDAVSGVVNFVLNKKFTGIAADAQYTTSERGDAAGERIGLAVGHGFAEDRGHFLLSGEVFSNNGFNRDDRKLGTTGATYVGSVPVGCVNPNIATNPGGCTAGGSLNPYIARNDVRITTASEYSKIAGSSVAGNPFVNYVFNANGTFRPFQNGENAGSVYQIGGDGFTIPKNVSATARLKTYQTFGRLAFDIAPKTTVYAQGVFSRSDVGYTSLANSLNVPTGFNIYKGNPYLPAALDASLPTANDFFALSEYNGGGPKPYTQERTDFWMATAGVDGTIGSRLRWNANYTHSDSQSTTAQSGIYDYKHAYAAFDVVSNPVGGAPICRVLLNPDPAVRAQYAGCQPVNLLAGDPSVTTPAGYAYATGTSRYAASIKQDSVTAALTGSLFNLPAGPVDFAIGGEYRKLSLNLTSNADPALLAGATAAQTQAIRDAYFVGLRGVPASVLFYNFTNVGTARGSQIVKEGFGELAVPILKDTTAFQELSVNAAGRVTKYSTSGTVTTWKVGGTWKPVSDLLLRATLSRDIRAPNLFELFAGDQSAVTFLNDPASNTSGTVNLVNGGNRALTPEIGKTFTLGGVFSPRFLPGFNISVDYYRLNIQQQIASLLATQIINNCYASAGAPECALITRASATSFPSLVRVAPANISFLTTRGIDIDVGYRSPLAGGNLSLRLYASRLLNYQSQQYAAAPVLEYAGISVVSGTPTGLPKWQGTLIADYSRGPLGLTVTEHYIGKQTIGIPGATPTYFVSPNVPAIWYTDLTLRVQVPGHDRFEWFATVNNLFDKDPPLIPSTIPGGNLPTNQAIYDTIGRAFTAGVKIRF